MKKASLWIVLFFVCSQSAGSVPNTSRISDYSEVSIEGQYNGKAYIAIRQFSQGGTRYYLAYNPQTLYTTRTQMRDFKAQRTPSITPHLLTSNAITWVPKGAVVLTMDLCPSPKPLDKEIITQIPSCVPRPVPIGIAISGEWILTHPQDLEWLKTQEELGNLKITWINHSQTHPYNPHVPYTHTFLLTPGLSIRNEVLQAEITMLEHGLIPSVFFRYPGLISRTDIDDYLHYLHLIPVGATAWLAKGQEAKPGRIILVHGNGNEPKGVQLLISWYAQFTPFSGKWVSLENLATELSPVKSCKK